MKFCIYCSFSLSLLLSPAALAEEPLTDAQRAKIRLIRSEIRLQIEQLEELERKLISAVIDEELQAEHRLAELPAEMLAGMGLVGRANVAGRDSDILFLYSHARVLNPEPVRSRIDGDFVLTLRGRLQVPRDMVVKAWHAGGGVNGDVNTLFVDDRKISSVGDDRSKYTIDALKLARGWHTVRWELTGGTFRHNLLKFVDAETNELLSLAYARDNVPDAAVSEVVRIGTDQLGWPIPQDWQVEVESGPPAANRLPP